jgi:hypothetical protein
MMERNSSSLRDEGGFVFHYDGNLFRHVDRSFQDNYEFLLSSGLYDSLTSKGLLIKHQEEDLSWFADNSALNYKVIRPDHVPFISYPFEWSFNQLKDAALATLEIQSIAISHGMILKDSSAYNIQFIGGKPCLIDSLSFIKLGTEKKPWVAYKQFCEHFLVPLALMSYLDNRLNLMLRSFLDGVPLELGSELLPARSYLSIGLLIHIHLHARFHRKYSVSHKGQTKVAKNVSQSSLLGLNESLRSSIRKLRPRKGATRWSDYYQQSVGPEYQRTKKEIVEQIISTVHPKLVWDVGANNGEFSRLFSQKNIHVISLDNDPSCVDENYLLAKQNNDTYIHPLFFNIIDPSPDLGWANTERLSFFQRSQPDLITAFAIIHHLSISQNIGFDHIAGLFSAKCRYLLIEFLEQDDPRVLELLTLKENVHGAYTKVNFENSFTKYYQIIGRYQTENKSRSLYLMESQAKK